MPDSTCSEIVAAMAAQIQDRLCGTADPLIELLTVYAGKSDNPTPPAIDFLPADPWTVRIGMGRGNHEFDWLVRARVLTADEQGAEDVLYSLMDTRADTSLEGAIDSDPTLGGAVEDAVVTNCTGWTVEGSIGPDGSLMGVRWTVRVTP